MNPLHYIYVMILLSIKQQLNPHIPTKSSFSLYLVSSLILQLTHFIFAERNGLTIKLIHRDSIESPLYPGNLTYEERIARILRQSKTRFNHLTSMMEARNQSVDAYDLDQIRSNVHYDGIFYLASVGIGTFQQEPSYQSFFLMLDTGSSLIWTQCVGCEPKCFNQSEPLYYPYGLSLTYHPLTCNDHNPCRAEGNCQGRICRYSMEYGGSRLTKGVLAREVFTFPSEIQQTENVELIMGCGLEQTNFNFSAPQNEIAGVLGIGNNPGFSFIGQLGSRAQNQFSHCLQPWREDGRVMNTVLRFGDDARFGQGQQVFTTPLFQYQQRPHYYLQLQDISIGDGFQRTRLNFTPGTFTLRRDGSGGCVIDTGSPITLMFRPHYDRLTSVLSETRFDQWRRVELTDYDYCFFKPTEGMILPSMTFHFLGADYEVRPQQMFLVSEKYVCLGINAHNESTKPLLIGNYMQINHNIMYDLTAMKLSFAREECDNNL